jgi:uncharacterized repeat protein (TIGR01451 family)
LLNGEIYKSNNEGLTWTKITSPNLCNSYCNTKLYFCNNRLFLTGLKSFYSDDLGESWTEMKINLLPNDKLLSLTCVNNLLFANATCTGTYLSVDNGENWQSINNGLEDVFSRKIVASEQNLFVSSYSSGVWKRSLDFVTLTGTVYSDENGNAKKDSTEVGFPQILIAVNDEKVVTSSIQNGDFSLYIDPTFDTIQVISPSDYVTVVPPFYSINFNQSVYDFGLQIEPNIKDLSIVSTLYQPLRPGFTNNLTLTIKNEGTIPSAPSVNFEIPNWIEVTNSSPLATQIGNFLTWDLDVLQPFQTINIAINFKASQTLQIGEIVNFSSSVLPLIDEKEANNLAKLTETVVGSFDPNDKSVLPKEEMTPENADSGEPLIYTVRFQNTGNYEAEFVKISDSLSQNLDISSLKILSSSHSFTWSIKNRSVVEFIFENIFLQPANTDELKSQGNIKFSIKTKKGLKLGQFIDNKAFIYFDFNAPIVTNSVKTTIKLKSNDYSLSNDLEIYPNPAFSSIWIRTPQEVLNEEEGILHLLDLTGKSIFSSNINLKNTPIQINLPEKIIGIYFVEIITSKKVFTGKLELISRL